MLNKPISCRAIFFDAGGTLFYPSPSVGEIYARVAAGHGITQAPHVLEERFHEAWHNRGGLASLEGAATPGLEKRWWRNLVKDVFGEMSDRNGFDVFFDELYRTFGTAQNWKVFPEVIETLSMLKSKGFRMGIISNWDSRLMGLCRDMDLEEYFDFILISAVVGHSKPGARIFRDALDMVQCAPQEALHVGDSFHDDYEAALNAGLNAIYLDRAGRCRHSVPRIEQLGELESCVCLC